MVLQWEDHPVHEKYEEEIMEHKDRVAIVTGAARGLGKCISELLAKHGAKVALWDIQTIDLKGGFNAGTGQFKAWLVDMTDEEKVRVATHQVAEEWGGIDILVNNAGILKHLRIEEMTLRDFESVIRVNLTGTFLACKYVVPYMKKRGKGKIVNIASLSGRTGRPGVGVNYAASKAGVIGLTQTLAREQGPNGIYVNCVCPGPILTELTKQVPSEVFATWNIGRAVEKDGKPEDVAEAVFFLASDRSDWITGATLDINGGILIR
ncbi:MAG: SDR family oxidoreductase [Deltaproteobacteria bacterium]|nr:SDR family oxidoreductase [Deltaproteobacteria bacterium]